MRQLVQLIPHNLSMRGVKSLEPPVKYYARVTGFVIIHKNNYRKYPLLFQDYFIAYPCSTVLALCVVEGASLVLMMLWLSVKQLLHVVLATAV